jgi:hypothetical protein
VRSRRFRAADLKVFLHSRVRCCARRYHRNAARCSLGLVPLLRFRRLLRSALRRGPISSHPSRKRAAPGGSRADRTREGGCCDWPEPAVHPAFRRHLSPRGQGGRASQVLRARRVGGPLPPRVPEGSTEVAPSGTFRWMSGRASRPVHRGGFVVARLSRSSLPCGRPRGGGPRAVRIRTCRNGFSSVVATTGAFRDPLPGHCVDGRSPGAVRTGSVGPTSSSPELGVGLQGRWSRTIGRNA